MLSGLVLLEDASWRRLRPLTDTLPVPALAFGASTLGERLARAMGLAILAVAARADVLAAWNGVASGEEIAGGAWVLVVDSAALPGPWLDAAKSGEGRRAWRAGADRVVAARLPWSEARELVEAGERASDRLASLAIPSETVEARVIEYPWHLIEWNADELRRDLEGRSGLSGEVHSSAVLLDPERIEVAAGARVDPLACLDARGGPISIGEGAVVQPHTLVIGPCAIGARTQLLGGVIGGSTIGPECRLAGEIEACVWQGWSNKRHHGFLGHSAIGEWVNLGALTTTSDLKNNYGPVRVRVDGAEVDSGNPKVGSVIGAHVKTGIGTLLPTGASLGVGANLFGGGSFAPRHLPAFAWWDGERTAVHDLEKFLATARIAMSRRGRALTPADESLLRRVFASTAAERQPPKTFTA